VRRAGRSSRRFLNVQTDGLQQRAGIRGRSARGQAWCYQLAWPRLLKDTSQKNDPQSNIRRPNNGKSATGEKLRNTCRIKPVMFVKWEVSAPSD
jgi:hypothetical protein